MTSRLDDATTLTSDCSVKIRRKLGWGRCGAVYDARINDTECALKVFKEKKGFVRELWAYQTMAKSDALRTCVPAGKFIFDRVQEAIPRSTPLYRRGLCIDLIHGKSLDQVIDSLQPHEWQRLHESLRDALRALHEAGLCHGDIREQNIMHVEDGVRLIDFSHASLKTRIPPEAWKVYTDDDHALVNKIFAQAKARRAAQHAAEILDERPTDDANVQRELADALDSSCPSDSLLDRVQNDISNPIPVLALSVVRAIRRRHRINPAWQYIKTYLSSRASSLERDKDPILIYFRLLLARYNGIVWSPDAFTLYEKTIADFKESLGARHSFTVRMRFDYAEFLRDRGKKVAAMNVCLDALLDVSGPEQKSEPNCSEDPALAEAEAWIGAFPNQNLVEFAQSLLRWVEDEPVHSRAEMVLRQVSRSEDKDDGPDQAAQSKDKDDGGDQVNTSKRSAAQMDSTDDPESTKRVKGEESSIGEKEGAVE